MVVGGGQLHHLGGSREAFRGEERDSGGGWRSCRVCGGGGPGAGGTNVIASTAATVPVGRLQRQDLERPRAVSEGAYQVISVIGVPRHALVALPRG